MPDLSHENTHGRLDGRIICGADEVGRGPLAGPVVAAAVILPATLPEALLAVNDSKALSPKKREMLLPIIQEHCVWAVAHASVEEIDTINILQASLLAMTRAIDRLSDVIPAKAGIHRKIDVALIDGNKTPKLACKAVPIIKGDSASLSIAAASIIAKVARDKLMCELHESYFHYGWDKNAGYPTPDHLAALSAHGPCQHHRTSFAPVRRAMRDR